MSIPSDDVVQPGPQQPRRQWIRWLVGAGAVLLLVVIVLFQFMLPSVAQDATATPTADVARTSVAAQNDTATPTTDTSQTSILVQNITLSPTVDASPTSVSVQDNTPLPTAEASPTRVVVQTNTPLPRVDVARTSVSAKGLYRGSFVPSLDPITIDRLHTWTLHIESADGQPVEAATVTVHGDMPGHGHGLPTKPIVSEHGNKGDYLVEGMKFQMAGAWYVEFDITSGGQQDTLRFDFVLT